MTKKILVIAIIIIVSCIALVSCNNNYTELGDKQTLCLGESENNYQTYKNEKIEQWAICYGDINAQYQVKYVDQPLTEKEAENPMYIKICPVSIKTTYSYVLKEKEYILKKDVIYTGFDALDDWISVCLKDSPKRSLNLKIYDYKNNTTEIKYKGSYYSKIGV